LNFDYFKEEVKSGTLIDHDLHSKEFMEKYFMKLEENDFALIKLLNEILFHKESSIQSKKFACFDLGEFARLYPLGRIILNRLNFKENLFNMIESNENSSLNSIGLETLQKLIISSYSKHNHK
jgi:V-type H+-transporting ATPase subunit H